MLRFWALLLVACALCAQEELAPDQLARIDRLLAVAAEEPGCALGIVSAQGLIYAQGYGLADLEQGTPIDSRSIFRIASTSKQFTAACIMLLVLDGALELEADIRTWLPALPAYEHVVRVRHLVHHTSGIPDYLDLIAEDASVDDAYAALCAVDRLEFKPGSRFAYSNSGYFLLSLLVAEISGKSLRAFAEERLFEPLGMSSTHFHDDAGHAIEGRTLGYSPRRRRGFVLDVTDLEMVGDGGLFTSVADLALWEQNLHEPNALLERLLERGSLNDGTRLSYAAGIEHGRLAGHATLSHGGAFVGYGAEILRLPEQQLSIIILCNRSDAEPEEWAEKIARILLEE